MKVIKQKIKETKIIETNTKKRDIGINKFNLILLLISTILLTLGYTLMSRGDINISPVILVITYIILIPISLLIKQKNE